MSKGTWNPPSRKVRFPLGSVTLGRSTIRQPAVLPSGDGFQSDTRRPGEWERRFRVSGMAVTPPPSAGSRMDRTDPFDRSAVVEDQMPGAGLLFGDGRFHDLNGVPAGARWRYEHRRDDQLVAVLDGVVTD